MKAELDNKGFTIIKSIYSNEEVEELLHLLNQKEISGQFGVREFLFKNPEITSKVLNEKLRKIISDIAPNCKKAIKSIYFDKPPHSNWIVNWHQDLTINLANRIELDQ